MGVAKSEHLQGQATQYFYFVVKPDGKTSGPFSFSEVLQMIAEKQITYRSYCWRSGFREWRPIISTEDFRSEFRGDALLDPSFPSHEIPNEVERHGVLRRVQASSHSKDRKVVVTFAKTKIRRVSVYEWCFALLFSLGLAFFTAQWTLKEAVFLFQQRVQETTVGLPQEVGAFFDQSPMPEYTLEPLKAAPAAPVYQGPGIPTEAVGLLSPVGDLFISTGGRYVLGGAEHVEFWRPEKHDLPFVYQKPLHVRGYLDFSENQSRLLVSHPGSPIKSP